MLQSWVNEPGITAICFGLGAIAGQAILWVLGRPDPVVLIASFVAAIVYFLVVKSLKWADQGD